MRDLGISSDSFNPHVLYVFKETYDYSTKVKPHSHDFSTMVVILNGTCSYQINSTIYNVGEGDIIICNPWAFHNKIISHNEVVTEFHLAFNNVLVRNLPKNFILSEESCPIIKLGGYLSEFMGCINELLINQEKQDPDCEIIIKTTAMRLIGIILKAINIGNNQENESGQESIIDFESSDKANIVNNIISYIDNNFMKDLTLNKLSQNIYLSPTYLSKIFKEEKGDSPINYLIKVRLTKAREILESENISIKSVAKSVGYDDAYYFSKLFKKYYGFPPSVIKNN